MRMKLIALLLLMVLAVTPACRGTDWFVSTNGSGNGSDQFPWALQVALTKAAVQPGDTVWLRGGTYFPSSRILTGTNFPGGAPGWRVSISGTTTNLITFRSYPSEWAKVDRPWRFGNSDCLRFRDLEFFDSLKGVNPGHPSYPDPRPWVHFDDSRGQTHHEWINCIIHDVNNVWATSAAGRLIRGCVIWHSGNSHLDHVCYNCPDEFTGNISGWHSCDALNLTPRPFLCRSNIFFGSGQTLNERSGGDFRLNIDSIVEFNYTYNRYTNNRTAPSMIVSDGSFNINNNKMVSCGACIMFSGSAVSANVRSNTFHMGQAFDDYVVLYRGTTNNSWSFNDNRYTAQPPSRPVMFEDPGSVRKTFVQWRAAFPSFDTASTSTNTALPPDSVHVIPNQDEPKRAHIAIFNFATNSTATVSLPGVLNAGDRYSLYSAQNYGAGPIQTGTYNGASISVPMTNLSVAPLLYSDPIWGLVAPPPTSPEFAAFVLIGSSASGLGPATGLHVIPPN